MKPYYFDLQSIERRSAGTTPATEDAQVQATLAVAERLERLALLMEQVIETIALVGR